MTQKTIIELLNQLFEVNKKQKQLLNDKLDHNLERMRWLFEQEGYTYKDPTGEMYTETRMDCQSTIIKEEEPFTITDTIKPIILQNIDGIITIIQQARVVIK